MIRRVTIEDNEEYLRQKSTDVSFNDDDYKNDIEMWKNGKLDYSYNTALYRNIGLNILKEYYGSV